MNYDLIYNPKDYSQNDGQHDFHVFAFVDHHYDPEMDEMHQRHMATVNYRDEYSGWGEE